jgi:hypothetical protein
MRVARFASLLHLPERRFVPADVGDQQCPLAKMSWARLNVFDVKFAAF